MTRAMAVLSAELVVLLVVYHDPAQQPNVIVGEPVNGADPVEVEW
jgi:hypothetical protein